MRLISAILLLWMLATAAPAAEGQWGTLTGRFVVQGAVPEREPHKPGNDPVCHAAAPVDESVLVSEEGGLQNAVVSLRSKRGQKPAIHPDYQKLLEKSVELTNRKCVFFPRVTILRTGQELIVKNADPTAHNTKFDLIKNTPVNRLIPAGGDFAMTLSTAERLPTPVSCNIHPFMRGYVMVRDDPYAAVTDAAGRFRIEKLPAGELQFQFWHETGYLKEAAFRQGKSDRRGRVRLTIPPGGELDLGDIAIPSELLVRAR